jgi:hypothetical protein
MSPQVPAHESFARQPVYREWWRMHEALVRSHNPEGRKIPLDPPTVVDHSVRVVWAVSIVMDELIQVQVAEQSCLLTTWCAIRLGTSLPWALV